MKKFSTRDLTLAAVIAALYAALTMIMYAPSYFPMQVRASEALTVLPFLFPAAAPGVFMGCLIANIISPYGVIDMVFGSGATLLAAVLTSKCKHPWIAPLPPVLCNAVIVGATIAYAEVGFGGAFWPAFAFNFMTVGAGQVISCYGLGLIILYTLPKIPFFAEMISPKKLELLSNRRRREAI